MHVHAADEAYLLGGASAKESYLSTEKLIDVLSRSGADAVHPGYGFLAENADFARAVIAAGATWVGPPPEAIELMGSKITSREAAAHAGVAPVPGTHRSLAGAARGGRLRRRLWLAGSHQSGLRRRWPGDARRRFGSRSGGRPRVGPARGRGRLSGARDCYVEKYLSWPRHVEVQVIGDSHGNVVHLGTRTARSRRRYQKLVEEAPAPDLPPAVAAAMCEGAVRVARACGYENAGTVELIYQDGEFYFLEMNTRLQVEHPVTEMVTGLDLVGLQFLVASGQPLPFSQHDVRLHGPRDRSASKRRGPCRRQVHPYSWAHNPLSGRRRAVGAHRRRLAEGDTVSPYYDNLVAKVVAWGPDRESARRRLLRALSETEVDGVATTIPAHLAVLAHPDFIEVRHSTDLAKRSGGPLGHRSSGEPSLTHQRPRNERTSRLKLAAGASPSVCGYRQRPSRGRMAKPEQADHGGYVGGAEPVAL